MKILNKKSPTQHLDIFKYQKIYFHFIFPA